MRNILLSLILYSYMYGSCGGDIAAFKAATQRASVHIEAESSDFDILLEINIARHAITSAIVSCKKQASKAQIVDMKKDLKKLNKLKKVFSR